MPQPFEVEFQPSKSVAHESLFPGFGICCLLDSRLRGMTSEEASRRFRLN
jgi:hypothetical protein